MRARLNDGIGEKAKEREIDIDIAETIECTETRAKSRNYSNRRIKIPL